MTGWWTEHIAEGILWRGVKFTQRLKGQRAAEDFVNHLRFTVGTTEELNKARLGMRLIYSQGFASACRGEEKEKTLAEFVENFRQRIPAEERDKAGEEKVRGAMGVVRDIWLKGYERGAAQA